MLSHRADVFLPLIEQIATMKKIEPENSPLLNWLSEQECSLEALAESDSRLYTLVDDYVRLMDAVEYWGQAPGSQIETFTRLLKNKELEIMRIISNGIGEQAVSH